MTTASSSSPSSLASPVSTETITHSGLRFTVDVAGPAAGEPVLLLHGFPQSRAAWRSQLPALAAAGFRAYAPDQRGYSTHARPNGVQHYEIQHLVGDGLALMDAVGANRFHLVGHDWGGHLAWSIALQAPERVTSLAVLSRPHPQAFVAALRGDPEQKKRSGHHSSLLADGVAAQMRASDFAWFRALYQHQGVPEEGAVRYLATLSEPGAVEAAIDWYRASATAMRREGLGAVSMPTMYVWGSNDSSVGRMAAEGTAQYGGPRYRFVEIDGAGHFLTDDSAQRVNELLVAHLVANRPAADSHSSG